MMAVHELGHMLHAWISGGIVTKVLLHPLAISRTDVSPNPHPLFVAWGGIVWGCLIPMIAWLALRWAVPSYAYMSRFFAGFCSIANGAYLAGGYWMTAGDVTEIMRNGCPAVDSHRAGHSLNNIRFVFVAWTWKPIWARKNSGRSRSCSCLVRVCDLCRIVRHRINACMRIDHETSRHSRNVSLRR